MTQVSFDPRTGGTNGTVSDTSADDVDAILAAAAGAAPVLAALSPADRADILRAIAARIDQDGPALVDVADRETALGHARLAGEVARAAAQLRFYADVCEEGSWLEATLDSGTGTSSPLARVAVSLGPVAVFGASNFPFAFGVVGNDTASALAAGCPVVAKAHPAHPLLSRRLAQLVVSAAEDAGAPAGAFGMVSGFQAGTQVVGDARISAVAFTGSQAGGMALWRLAAERPVPVPVFAEMGTVNPVVVTGAGAQDADAVATGFVASFTLGSGQFCTKPGLLLAPRGSGLVEAIARATKAAHVHQLLTAQIAAAMHDGVGELTAAGGTILARGTADEHGWRGEPVVIEVPGELIREDSAFVRECFGPVAVVAEYDSDTELFGILDRLQGSLAASVMGGGVDDPEVAPLIARLARQVGRVTVGDWPTGVAWTWAQHHGGPWPSTSAPAATSVGAGALRRFTRPVAFQNVPDRALPPALQEANPWRLPRRVDGRIRTP